MPAILPHLFARDVLCLDFDADLLADRDAARLERDVPLEAPVLAVDAAAGTDAAAGVAPGILDDGRQRLHVQRHRAGDAADGQVAGHAQVAGGAGRGVDPRRTERDRRVVGDVEEVGAAQVVVALRLARVDAARVDADVDARPRQVLLVDEHGPRDGPQVAAHVRQHQVADLEAGGGVGGVDVPGPRGGRGGGGDGVREGTVGGGLVAGLHGEAPFASHYRHRAHIRQMDGLYSV